jgi:hypothetical protein
MRSTIVAAMLAISTLVAVPAFAAPAQGNVPTKTAGSRGDAQSEKGQKHFPMPAAEFQAKVNARQTKGRARMEEKAAKLPADQAKELRAHFDANIAKVNAEVAKAVADGTVTKEEAQAVRAASPHHGKHARARHGKGGKKGNGDKK